MPNTQLSELAVASLEERKAIDICCLDVSGITDITDYMVIASGTSKRHVSAIVDFLLERCREAGVQVIGVEGKNPGEWVLVDMVDVIVHVMLPATREFYDLERLWASGEGLRLARKERLRERDS